MNNNRPKFTDLYVKKEELGRGAFGVVYRVVEKDTNEEYAVKVLEKQNLTQKEFMELNEEARICRKLNHPHIVRLHRVITEKDGHYFVLDLVTGGELFDDIVKHSKYTEELAAKCMMQLFDGIEYCHRMQVVHRDLKPENLLLASKEHKYIKIADFGLAVEIEEEEEKWWGIAGTENYMAPEIWRERPYGKPVDLWSCGVIMYILLAGHFPFGDEDEHEEKQLILREEYDLTSGSWSDITKEGKDLVSRQLCVDPSKRITATEALHHSWFKTVRAVPKVVLVKTNTRLKHFNARRKFKTAITAINITSAFKSLSRSSDHHSSDTSVATVSSHSKRKESSP